jgi:hypothetical protein
MAEKKVEAEVRHGDSEALTTAQLHAGKLSTQRAYGAPRSKQFREDSENLRKADTTGCLWKLHLSSDTWYETTNLYERQKTESLTGSKKTKT